jgi:hypothetical protein
MIRALFLIILCLSTLSANGALNVFTGDPLADVYIDGENCGKEQVVKKSLTEGTHYIQIKKNGTTVGSKTVTITTDQTETAVIDNFVDFKTNVASRGAIDVEAMRVRETRGNIGFGVYGGSPASGISLKWWASEKIGLQAIGYVNNFQGNIDSRGGARILFNFSESVYKGSPLTFYGAIGAGRSMIRNRADGEKNETYDLTEGALGLEFKIANLFNDPQDTKEVQHVVIDGDTSPFSILLTQLITGLGEGFMKFAHFSFELGVERQHTKFYSSTDDESSRDKIAAKVSGGCHVYF